MEKLTALILLSSAQTAITTICIVRGKPAAAALTNLICFGGIYGFILSMWFFS